MASPDHLQFEVGFPFQVDSRGRMANPGYERHVREMMELVLFTSPGERVNRPDFGAGLLQHLFDPANEFEADAVAYLVQSSLQQWLGEVLTVEDVRIDPVDAAFSVQVAYKLIGHRAIRQATFEPRGLP